MLQESTLEFLRQLSRHNDRDWFQAHKKDYKAAKSDFDQFVDQLIAVLAVEDKDLLGLQAKECVFRIYRDVRFSKNKQPYKPNFGASITKGGRKSIVPGYYIHLQPAEQSFIGGGMYRPPAPLLKAVRQEIDYNQSAFEAILKEPGFVDTYGSIQGDQLVRAPKGYDIDHPAIAWLKYKDIIAMKRVEDTTWTNEGAVQKIAQALLVMKPLKNFLQAPLADEEVKEALQQKA